jgi:imidazolonepropionase-like amidohydrolase
LAHTPVEPLTEYTLASWSDRVIVSTLSAFGGSSGAVANLRTLHARGATVLYGTDLGNTRQTGVQRREIELLMEAGLDGRAIIESGTSAPAAYWGVGELGALAPGKEASLMVLAENPYQNPLTLASPVAVLIRGEWRLRPPEL